MFEAFVQAVEETFDLMVEAKAHPVDVADSPPEDRPRPNDISAVISFTGGYFGTVILSFPSAVAMQIVERCTGEVAVTDEETADAVSEFLNMISGAAKRSLARSGQVVEMSLPAVVIGRNHQVFQFSSKPCMRIDFDSELGPFYIQMALEPVKRRTRIILTDDSRLSRRIMRNALQTSFEEAEFFECPDGISARRLIDDLNDEVDLLVLDFKMPGLSGIELLRALRTTPNKRRFPVFIVTSDLTAARQLRELEAELGDVVGPCGLLAKPFDAAEAREIAEALVRAGARQTGRSPSGRHKRGTR